MADNGSSGARAGVASLTLTPREVTGKKVALLRREGIIPVHLYGGQGGSLALQTTYVELRRLLPQIGLNIPVSISVEGKDGEDICFVREVQRNPVTDKVIHVDFLRTDVKRKVTANVPVNLVGTPPAVSLMGGTLIQNMLTVSVEALPLDMPTSFEIDVTGLEDFDVTIHVSDIVAGEGLTVMSSGADLVARVSPPRVEVEEVAEGVEGEEAAEGEDAGAAEETADSAQDASA